MAISRVSSATPTRRPSSHPPVAPRRCRARGDRAAALYPAAEAPTRGVAPNLVVRPGGRTGFTQFTQIARFDFTRPQDGPTTPPLEGDGAQEPRQTIGSIKTTGGALPC